MGFVESYWNYATRRQKRWFIAGAIISGVSVIFCIFPFAVTCGRFYAAPDFPGLPMHRVTPNPGTIAGQWLTWIFATVTGVGFMLAPVNYWAFFVTSLFSAVLGGVAFIVHVCVYILYDDQGLGYQTVALSAFNESYNLALEKAPYFEMQVEGQLDRGRRSGPCWSETFRVRAENWNTVDRPIPLTDEIIHKSPFRVETTINLHLAEKEEELINELKKEMLACQTRTDIKKGSLKTIVRGYIPDYDRNVIVTENGKRPSVINKPQSQFAVAFAVGTAYLYNVGRVVPVLDWTIDVNNVELNRTAVEGFNCEMIGQCTNKFYS